MKRTLLLCGSLALFAALCLVSLFLLAPVPRVEAQALAWPNPPYMPVNINFSSASAQTLVAAPGAGVSVCVYAMTLINAGASAITVNEYLDGGTTSVSSTYIASGGGAAFWPFTNNPKSPWFLTKPNTGFVIQTSSAVQINGSIYAATCP